LAAESTDALGATNKGGLILYFHALQFFGSWTLFQEAGQFFVDLFFYLFKTEARSGGDLNIKLSGDFVGVGKGGDVGGDLVVVDEALVEPGSFALGHDVGHHVQIVAVRAAEFGN